MIKIIAAINIKSEILLIVCILFKKLLLGALGSFFLRYKYSAICLKNPIINFFANVKSIWFKMLLLII